MIAFKKEKKEIRVVKVSDQITCWPPLILPIFLHRTAPSLIIADDTIDCFLFFWSKMLLLLFIFLIGCRKSITIANWMLYSNILKV